MSNFVSSTCVASRNGFAVCRVVTGGRSSPEDSAQLVRDHAGLDQAVAIRRGRPAAAAISVGGHAFIVRYVSILSSGGDDVTQPSVEARLGVGRWSCS
jgi:hypothetical protein